ncbi:MAG: hypothetical protein HZB29_13300 [Nitrospinae bacterium]|nr:hypothetical protein [Nitrospinota bacterium]
MPDEKPHDKNMEVLTRAIVEAITKSREVREAVRKLSETDEVCSKSFMVLMLKVANLADTMGLDFPDVCGHDAAPRKTRSRADEGTGENAPKPEAVEDGRALSKREKEFREFLAENFDTEAWLKKLGLKF